MLDKVAEVPKSGNEIYKASDMLGHELETLTQ